MKFRVWAPKAQQVQVQVNENHYEMQANGQGWWQSAEIDDNGAGSLDYGFIIDGNGLLPDPRSPWQPNGVHGLSRTVNHTAFAWTDAGFQALPLAAAVIYELHVGTFTPEGTFDAILPHLPELHRLGITHLEIMPVAQFSGQHGWGYDGVDLYAPHQAYGGPEGFKRLVNACHAQGIAVILDVVYNHVGPEGNYLSQFGPYFTDAHHTAWGQAVNMDGALSDEVRRFFLDNALMWLRDYHLDGLRLDAVHAIIDTSAVHFLEELTQEVKTLQAGLGRHLVVIAESDLNNPRLVRPSEMGGYGLDAVWVDDFHHSLHTLLTGENSGFLGDFGSMADLAKALECVYVYDGQFSNFRQRKHGRSPLGLPGYAFIGYFQNHDQIGNRAAGERIHHTISAQATRLGAALLLTSPFVPMLFQGEEWGSSAPFQYFIDHEDQELARLVNEGRKKEFGGGGSREEDIPSPSDPATFLRSKVDHNEKNQPGHAELLDWYARLIALRAHETALTDGLMSAVCVRFDEAARWLIMERGPLTVACNFSKEMRVLPIVQSNQQTLLASVEDGAWQVDGYALPAEGVVIFKLNSI